MSVWNVCWDIVWGVQSVWMQWRVHAGELCDCGVWTRDIEWAKLQWDVCANEWTDRVLWYGERDEAVL